MFKRITSAAFLAILLLVAVFCQAQRKRELVKDSCVNCLFMGLTRQEWEKKDKPFWDSIDRKAIKDAGGLYIGDLPSSFCCMTMGREGYYEIHIYHPSIDSTQIEKHYLIRRRLK